MASKPPATLPMHSLQTCSQLSSTCSTSSLHDAARLLAERAQLS